jgi:hypothetical protein
MAGRGPAPGLNPNRKVPEERRNRNKPAQAEVVAADGGVHGPALPDTHEWPAATLAWWETWRSSALAARFTDTDWSFLLDTAVLHADFWLGDRGVASELRLRVAKFGATPEDRARLRVEVGDPGKPRQVPARLQTKADKTRRARLLRAVGDGGDC